MPRFDSVPGSTRSPRPGRPAYLPPHLRDATPELFNHSTRGGGGGAGYRGGRASRGRGPPTSSPRGPPRGPSWARSPVRNNPSPNPNANPLGNIEDKFDDLDVIGEEAAANIDAYNDTQVEASGEDIPPPVSSFSDVDFPDALADNIKRCKYMKPTPIQKYAIPVAMSGRDLMACAQTGSGKTAAFCFPIISGILKDHQQMPRGPTGSTRRGPQGNSIAFPLALILSPTRELSCQIHDEAKKFSHQTGVKVVVAYGGAPIVQQLRNLERGVDILVATPGRLVDMIERAKISLKNVKYLALDEADRMLDMGFEPQIRKIVERMEMPPPGARQTMLFSATFPDEIQRLSSDFLRNYIFLTAGRIGSSTDLIVQKVDFVHDTEKRSHLMKLLHAHRANGTHGRHSLTLVFVETKKGADALEQWLSMKGFPSIAIHGDKVQMERERAMRSFKSGQTPILVATDVASRGLDIPHVAHVINFDLPKDIADYVHRIGRTGRAGKSGLATAFFSDKNHLLAKALVDLMVDANQEVPDWLNQYAETSSFNGGGGRANRYGNRKFGGHDYRSSTSKDNGNFNYSGQYFDAHYSNGAYAEGTGFNQYTPDVGYSAPAAGGNYFAVAPYNYGYGPVATGWE